MKKRISLIAFLASPFVLLASNTIYVKLGGTGNGTSWLDATGDLPSALFIARPGDQVWVAAATYYPTDTHDRRKAFTIPSGVEVYGGFAGCESQLGERDPLANQTTLSGDIGRKSDFSDNSFTVVFLINADEHTILDGFRIADGSADGTGPTADPERSGAGMIVDGSGRGNHCMPSIRHCTFQNNYARDGGAVYVNGKSGRCTPIFSNCQFMSNKADLDGGAVFNDGRFGGVANPVFNDCRFESNQGNYGGAMCNYGGKGESNPQLQRCVFRHNEAYLRGGAIFNMGTEGSAEPMVNSCQLVDNKAAEGGNIYTFGTTKIDPEPKANAVKSL